MNTARERRTAKQLLGPSAGAMILAWAGAAGAVGVVPPGGPPLTPVLQHATFYDIPGNIGGSSFGLINTPGTYSLPANAPGSATIVANLGADPNVSINYNANAGVSGQAFVDMLYQVEYFDSSPGVDQFPNSVGGTNESVTINVADSLTTTSGGVTATSQLLVYSTYEQFPYNRSHCLSTDLGCRLSGNSSDASGAPLTSANATMVANLPYMVELRVSVVGAGGSLQNDIATASVDPTFQGPIGGSGHFVFSPGVSAAAVPEPASWALMLAGLGALGMALRQRKLAIAA